MKKVVTIAITALGFGLPSINWADDYRGYHHARDNHIRYSGKHRYKHGKAVRHSYDRHFKYRSAPDTYVIHYQYDNDFYKWMGGIYLLNEVLHHGYH